jgi:hypothetical protein
MAHKIVLATAGLVVMLLVALSPGASAQGRTECLLVPSDTPADQRTAAATTGQAALEPAIQPVACATPQPYPGPFLDGPPGTTAPLGWGVLNITIAPTPAPASATVDAAPAAASGAGDRALPIAHTGTESYLLAYVGTGLVAFGAAALGMRRRYFFADDEY